MPVQILRDWENWTGLVHEALSYILEWSDVEGKLAAVFGIPGWTWENIILKIADGFLYIVTVADDYKQKLFEAIKPVMEAVWPLLTWSSDQWKFLITMVLNEIINTTSWFWDNFNTYVWGKLSAPTGALEKWLEGQADNLRDNILDLGNWFGQWLEELPGLPQALMGKIMWELLIRIRSAGADFLTMLLDMAEETISIIAWPVVNLGEKILEYVWGDDEG
jgi:hypothetical protein